MSNEETSKARVEAFIADFHAAWARSGSVPLPSLNPFHPDEDISIGLDEFMRPRQPPDFEAWQRELDVLVERHFAAGAKTGAEGCLSGKPDHDPARERIVKVEAKRAQAHVDTVFPDGALENHFRYHLILDDGQWRISKVVHSFALPEAPLIAHDEVERFLDSPTLDHAAEPVSEALARGMTALFSERFNVLEIGTITTSGMLTAHDLGWVRYDVAPFIRRVPAGSYSVDISRDSDETNVAVRVRFSEQEIAARIPATRIGSSSIVGVDAGNVAILDFGSLAGCSEVRIAEIYQDVVSQAEDLAATFSLTGAAQEAVVVQSGYGDGAYPAFWGIGADGSIVDLVIDFLVAVEDISTVVTAPWTPGPASHPDLAAHAFEIIVDAAGVRFRYREDAATSHIRQIRVLKGGLPIAGREGGLFVQGDISEQSWFPDQLVPADAIVEVTLSNGYRHI